MTAISGGGWYRQGRWSGSLLSVWYVHWGPLWHQSGGRGRSFDHGYQLGRVDDEVVVGEVGDGHVQ